MTRFLLLFIVALSAATQFNAARAADFTYDPATSAEVLKTWLNNAPVYFTVPASSRLKLPDDIDTSKAEQLIDFRHPDGLNSPSKPGLRFVVSSRKGFGTEMARTGLIQPGDLLLWFNNNWVGGGAYASVQMGISHAGLAYLKDGVISNIDNPLTDKGYHNDDDRFGGNYHDNAILHVVRPRGLTASQRDNISKWANRFMTTVANKFYGRGDDKLFVFDPHYNKPLYKPDAPLTFVQRLGQIGLTSSRASVSRKDDNQDLLEMFCAEFAWALLALKDCDPETSAKALYGDTVPQCIKPIMTPLPATGHYFFSSKATQDIGLADGPLIVLDTLNRSHEKSDAMIDAMFVAKPDVLKKMSSGHRKLAKDLQPQFLALKPYYKAIAAGGLVEDFVGGAEGLLIRQLVPANYSPTAFLVNTLIPTESEDRTMDYVATIKFTD